MTVLAGAAALAGVGYAFAHRSSVRSRRGPRGTRVAVARGSAASLSNRGKTPPTPTPAAIATEPASRLDAERMTGLDAERISSAPDALDVALDLEGLFDGKSESGVSVTARPHEHIPAPRVGDDEEAPSPDDLASTWLAHATESERSLGTADTIPDVEEVPQAMDEEGDASDASGDDVDDDETTAEYVRRHRISSMEWSAATAKKPV